MGHERPEWERLLYTLPLPPGLSAERLIQEVRFAREYQQHYAHGTDGHIRLMAIAMLLQLLESYERE